MKTIAVNEFKEIIYNPDLWMVETVHETLERDFKNKETQEWNDLTKEFDHYTEKVWFSYGLVKKISSTGDTKITTIQGWQQEDGDDQQLYIDPRNESYSASREGMSLDQIFEYDGPEVYSEGNRKLDLGEIIDLLPLSFF